MVATVAVEELKRTDCRALALISLSPAVGSRRPGYGRAAPAAQSLLCKPVCVVVHLQKTKQKWQPTKNNNIQVYSSPIGSLLKLKWIILEYIQQQNSIILLLSIQKARQRPVLIYLTVVTLIIRIWWCATGDKWCSCKNDEILMILTSKNVYIKLT